MLTATNPMLFIPPEPPVALRADTPVIIGRSRSCDLRLPSGDASRRHAEIVHSGDGFLLRDLASTNGTFVNGNRVAEHVLCPGDCIEIGSNEIRFCQVNAPLDSAGADGPGDAQTIIAERPAYTDEVFQGSLAEIPPFAVLQILEMGRKTGLLKLDTEDGNGSLWFEDGAPSHAENKHQLGFDAALSIIQANAGRFSFEPLIETPTRTIHASVTELLLEAARFLDEQGSV